MRGLRQRDGTVPRRGYRHSSRSSSRVDAMCSLPMLLLTALVLVAVCTTLTVLPDVKGARDSATKKVQTAGKVDDREHVPPILTLRPEAKPAPVQPFTPKPKPSPKTTPKPKPKVPKNPQIDYHFVHIPKCGGTSMTSVLRAIACSQDEVRNEDCCTSPGFCDHNAGRRCATIKGCINHIPQRKWLFKSPKSITLMREPFSRLVSAFFYRGHSPNLDFFQVRPEFKQIKLGKAPRVEFPEYIEMLEYQNIQTRMLGADSFPYRAVEITDEIFTKAKEALKQFFFVGIQEQYDLSVELLQRELGMKNIIPVKNERENSSPRTKRMKDRIRGDATLVARTRQVNDWDVQLYKLAVRHFCRTLAKHPDLMAKLDSKKVDCERSR